MTSGRKSHASSVTCETSKEKERRNEMCQSEQTVGRNTMSCVCSRIFPIWLLLCLTVCPCRGINVKVFSGQNAILPCRYEVKNHGICEICWMRGDVPNIGCGSEIIASDKDKVVRQTSHRYQLDGELQKGDASLTIHNTTLEDSGRYGCRIHVPGWFNDEKIIVNLVIIKGPEVYSLSPSTTERSAWYTEPTHVNSTNTSHYSNASTPEANKIKVPKDDMLPVTVVSILLILLAFGTAVYLIWKKKRRTRFLETDQNSNPSAIYSNSEVSVGLYSRSMAVENIYQLETESEYEQWSR